MVSFPINRVVAPTIIPAPDLAAGFVTEPRPNCWTWTWTTRLGELLHDAESRYGARDASWTILGVEFGGEVPMIWYPGDRRHVAVRLPSSSAQNPGKAFSELAHEVVHLLAPNGGGAASNFEEGLATLFSDARCDLLGTPRALEMDSYVAAKTLVGRMLDDAPDAVRELRRHKPAFDDWQTDDLLATGAKITPEEADWLLRRFDR